MEQAISLDKGAASQENYEVDMSILSADSGAASIADGGQGSQKSEDTLQVEIDDRYKGLSPEEGALRTLQSRLDMTTAEKNKLAKEIEAVEQYKNLFGQLTQDEKMLYAFVNEVKPGLLPKPDPSSIVKSKLKEEFGDYKPELTRVEAERDDPGGKDYFYYKRLDQLTQEAWNSANGQNAGTLKEYLANLRKEQEEKAANEQKAAMQEVEDVKKAFNMQDSEVQAVSQWAEKLGFKELVAIHRYLRRANPKAGNIENIAGASPGTLSEREKFLKEIYR